MARRTAGLSLVELMIALVVIAIALLAIFSLVVSSSQVQQETREKALAYNAARLKIEEMRSKTFSSIWSIYKAGGSTGNTFAVDGLQPIAGDAAVGFIFFPERNNLLSETVADSELGMPKDLNRDGDALDDDVTNGATIYKILPVRIRIRWQGVGDKSTSVTVTSFITDK